MEDIKEITPEELLKEIAETQQEIQNEDLVETEENEEE